MTQDSEENNLVAIKQKNALSWALLGADVQAGQGEKWGSLSTPKHSEMPQNNTKSSTQQHWGGHGMPHRWLWLTVKSNWRRFARETCRFPPSALFPHKGSSRRVTRHEQQQQPPQRLSMLQLLPFDARIWPRSRV